MKIMWKLIWDHRLSILCPMIFNGCGIGAAVSKVSEKKKIVTVTFFIPQQQKHNKNQNKIICCFHHKLDKYSILRNDFPHFQRVRHEGLFCCLFLNPNTD